MASFGERSRANLEECHEDLQLIFNTVIQIWDCSIIEGYRGKEEQNRYFSEGKSKIKFPDGKHNQRPSMAVDAPPYPIDWNDVTGFIRYAHFVLGVAAGLYAAGKISHKLRWGGDWDRDFDLEDQRFNDYPHFELCEGS